MSQVTKVQTIGDDLRLPCFVTPFPPNIQNILSEIDELTGQNKKYGYPIPFQSKHLSALKRNTWFVLQRPPDKSRTGFIVVCPADKWCVYICPSNSRPHPRVILLRLRQDPQMFEESPGLTVFAATLSPTQRKLWIEDTLMWKGKVLIDCEPFSTGTSGRWVRAVQWIEHFCLPDARLLGGLEIELANWSPLNSIKPEGVWDLVNDCVGSRKLLWIANRASIVHAPAQQQPAQQQPDKILAIRGSGPEQWNLQTATGKDLGRAFIRTLAVADKMRSAQSPCEVSVIWNESFKKYEIT